MRRHLRHQRHLRFEQLEQRQLMAADLAWSVDTPYERGNGLVSDGENVYISTANTGSVIKYDGDGNQVWSVAMPGNIGRLTIDGDFLYASGTDSNNTGYFSKLSLDGSLIWTEQVNAGVVSNGYVNIGKSVASLDDLMTPIYTQPSNLTGFAFLATDTAFYIGGNCELGGYVTKFDLQGNEIWTHNFMGNPEEPWGTSIYVTQLVAAPNGVYFSLRADYGLTIDGDTYQGIYNMDHYATGLLVEDDVVWYKMNGKYGELQSIDGILFIDGAGYDRDGNLMYAVEGNGSVEIIRADQHSFSAVFYHQYLTRYDYSPNDPGQISIETMGFVDPPAAASFTAPAVSTSSDFSFSPALYSAFAEYWAEQGEIEDLTKKRRAA